MVVFPLVSSYGQTHIGRAVVPEPELGAAFEEVSFTTDDGLELQGWYVPSRNRAAVIAFPGRKGPQRQTRMLVRHGYGVLLFDRRGEGDSEGDPNAVGWNGDRDIKAAIAFLHERPDVDPDRIGGIGLSVGGELMLETAAETDALKAVVSDGAGIRSVREASLEWSRGADLGWDHRRDGGVLGRRAATEPERRGRAHLTPSGLLHLRGAADRAARTSARTSTSRPASPRRSGRSRWAATSAGPRQAAPVRADG